MTAALGQQQEQVGSIGRAGLIAVLAAAAAGVIVFLIATGVFNQSILIPAPPDMQTLQPMTLIPVIGASVFGAVAGTIVFAALGRFTARPITFFRVIGLVFLVMSLGGPLSLPNLETGARIAMIAMHIAVGLAIIGVLTTAGRKS